MGLRGPSLLVAPRELALAAEKEGDSTGVRRGVAEAIRGRHAGRAQLGGGQVGAGANEGRWFAPSLNMSPNCPRTSVVYRLLPSVPVV